MKLIGVILLLLAVAALFTGSLRVCLAINCVCLGYCALNIWRCWRDGRGWAIRPWLLEVAVNLASMGVNVCNLAMR